MKLAMLMDLGLSYWDITQTTPWEQKVLMEGKEKLEDMKWDN